MNKVFFVSTILLSVTSILCDVTVIKPYVGRGGYNDPYWAGPGVVIAGDFDDGGYIAPGPVVGGLGGLPPYYVDPIDTYGPRSWGETYSRRIVRKQIGRRVLIPNVWSRLSHGPRDQNYKKISNLAK